MIKTALKIFSYLGFLLIPYVLKSNITSGSGSSGGYSEVESLGNGKYIITSHVYYNCYVSFATDTTSPYILKVGRSDSSIFISSRYIGSEVINNYCNSCRSDIYSDINFIDHRFRCTVDITQEPLKSVLANNCYLYIRFRSINAYGIPNYIEDVNFFTTMVNTCLANSISHKTVTPYKPIVTKFFNNVYYNPGFYNDIQDSLKFELVCMEKDFSGSCVTYKSGFTAQYPISCYCTGGGNDCTPNPYVPTPRGFYLNNTTGDVVFRSTTSEGPTGLAIRAHQYKKDSLGNWQYFGYVTQNLIKGADGQGNLNYISVPKFDIPQRIDLCENDSVLITIKPTGSPLVGGKYYDTLYFRFTGNASNYDVTLIDTNINRPIAKIKLKAPPGIFDSKPYILTVRVRNDTCGYQLESAKSIIINYHKGISSTINCSKGTCNSIVCKAKSITPKLNVLHNWLIYKDSFNSNPIYNLKGDSFTISGLQKAKYYIKCVVSTPAAYCTQRTYFDSIDLIKNWPDIDFDLNSTVFCPNSKDQIYYPNSFKNMDSITLTHWKFQQFESFSDTLFYNLDTNTTVLVTLIDKKGCELTKPIDIVKDSIYALEVTSDTLLCEPTSLQLRSLNKLDSSTWPGYWTVINGNEDTTQFGLSYSVNYPFKYSNNIAHSLFYSRFGCIREFSTIIEVDTTKITVKDLNAYCRSNKLIYLDSIPHNPSGGLWNVNNSETHQLRVDTFATYPKQIECIYNYTNSISNCKFQDTAKVIIEDTSWIFNYDTSIVCLESKFARLSELFKPANDGGIWDVMNGSLIIQERDIIEPFNSQSGIYDLIYAIHGNVCPSNEMYFLNIDTPKISMYAEADPMLGFIPLTVNFTGYNKIGHIDSTTSHLKSNFLAKSRHTRVV